MIAIYGTPRIYLRLIPVLVSTILEWFQTFPCVRYTYIYGRINWSRLKQQNYFIFPHFFIIFFTIICQPTVFSYDNVRTYWSELSYSFLTFPFFFLDQWKYGYRTYVYLIWIVSLKSYHTFSSCSSTGTVPHQYQYQCFDQGIPVIYRYRTCTVR